MDDQTRRDMYTMAEYAEWRAALDLARTPRSRRRRWIHFLVNAHQVVYEPITNSEPGLGSLHRRPRSGAGGHIPNTSSDRGTRVGPEPDRIDTPAGTESDTARVASPLEPTVAVATPGVADPTSAPPLGVASGAAGSRDRAPGSSQFTVSGSRLPGRPHL
jgi:hypothetical protein